LHSCLSCHETGSRKTSTSYIHTGHAPDALKPGIKTSPQANNILLDKNIVKGLHRLIV
jgi:hypothetical protein